MAFFGLTKLGEQNLFAANSRGEENLGLFNENDFQAAFDQTVGEKRYILAADLEVFFQKLYCGPLFPSEELEFVTTWFGSQSEKLTKQQFLEQLIEYRSQMQEERRKRSNEDIERKSVEFRSNVQFRESAKKLKYGPYEKYQRPLITSQELGWSLHESKFGELNRKGTKRYPKVSSEETKFAAAMASYGAF